MESGPVMSVIASLKGATTGAWIGAKFALNRFKKERSFDRQIDCSERMLRFLFTLSSNISITRTIKREIDNGQELLTRRTQIWVPVQFNQLELKSCSWKVKCIPHSLLSKHFEIFIIEPTELNEETLIKD